jgi:hypothetical protein
MDLRRLCLVAASTVIFTGAPSAALGDEVPYWPSEQEARLEELDSELIDTQQKLFAARQKKDAEATADLTATFKDCQEKRMKLLRAMGHLPNQE